MRVEDRENIRTHLVDRKVHCDFGRPLARALDLIAIQVANDQIVRGHHAFADGRAGAQNSISVQSHADISIVGRDPALLIHQFSDVNDVLPVLQFGLQHPERSIVAIASEAYEIPSARLYNGVRVDKRRMCPNCRAFVTTSDQVCPYCDAELGAARHRSAHPGRNPGRPDPASAFHHDDDSADQHRAVHRRLCQPTGGTGAAWARAFRPPIWKASGGD